MDYSNWGTALLGLALVYWIVATLVTYICEGWTSFWNTRAKGLQETMSQMLGQSLENNALSMLVREHPLLLSLRTKNRDPSYIPSGVFAKALIDVIATAAKNKEALGKVKLGAGATSWDFSAIEEVLTAPQEKKAAVSAAETNGPTTPDTGGDIPQTGTASDGQYLPDIPESVRLALAPLLARANRDVDAFEAQVAAWFDATMERTSGWYKRHTTKVLFVISFLLVGFFNIDTLMLVKHLSANPELRRALAREAEISLSAGSSDSAAQQLKSMVVPAVARSSLASSQMEALSTSQISGEGMVKEFGRTWAAAEVFRAVLCPKGKTGDGPPPDKTTSATQSTASAPQPATCNETDLIRNLDELITAASSSGWCPAVRPISAQKDETKPLQNVSTSPSKEETQLTNCKEFVAKLQKLQVPLAAFLAKGREEEARAKDIFAALPHLRFWGFKDEYTLAAAKEVQRTGAGPGPYFLPWWILLKLGGILISAIMVSFGAPFWYDLMGRLSSNRATGPKPETGAMT